MECIFGAFGFYAGGPWLGVRLMWSCGVGGEIFVGNFGGIVGIFAREFLEKFLKGIWRVETFLYQLGIHQSKKGIVYF